MKKLPTTFLPFSFSWLTAVLCVSVSVFTAKAQIITTIAGSGGQGFSGDGGPATAADLYYPFNCATDAAGNVYIADALNYRVRKVNTSGIISTFAGTGASGYNGDNIQATAAQLSMTAGVATDAAGNVYIGDFNNCRVRKVNTLGVITTVAGSGAMGYGGDGGPATAASLFFPWNLTVDGAGNIYFSDDVNYRVRKVNTSGIITTVVGNGTAGFSGDGGQATAAQVNSVSFVSIDPSGNLYIADDQSNRTRKVNTSGVINTIAGTGAAGYNGDGIQATAASLFYSSGNGGGAIDFVGNIYIGDYGNNRIRRINSAGVISTIGGTGTAGFSGDGGPATAAKLNGPVAISIDGAGNIYITDELNDRIRKIIGGAPLPVQFLYLNCAPVSGGIELNWATASEINNKYFTVERSNDGENYFPISTVPGAGNSSSLKNYSFTDMEPGLGNNYYKLQQTDFDGRTVNLSATTVCNEENNKFLVFPNPSQGEFTVTIPTSTDSSRAASLSIYDMAGRLMYSKIVQDQQAIGLSLPSLAPGIYLLNVIIGEKAYNAKVLINK